MEIQERVCGMNRKVTWKMIWICLLVSALTGGAYPPSVMADTGTAEVTPPSFLDKLSHVHPRLLATADDFAAIRQKIDSDPLAAQWYGKLKNNADKILGQPASRYELPDGVRLLSISRTVLDRVYTLAMVYKMSGDARYLDRAWVELKAAADFPDWHPPHYLDTAEMTHAFAIGYDWLYNDWTGDQRTILRNAIVEKGLNTALPTYRGQKIGPSNQWFWLTTTNNWNVVVNGGISLGALAVGDEVPDLAEEILESAYKSIQSGLSEFEADGSYAEGIGYWDYATRYATAYFAGLKTAVGTDFGLSRSNGFPETGTFPIYMTGPKYAFNFGDAGSGMLRPPQLFWMANEFGNPLYALYEKQNAGTRAEDLLWYQPGSANAESAPLDKFFPSNNVALFHSDWSDPNALFAGMKGGDNRANHNDLDLGTFVLDALGERWAEDLGAEDYNLPGYFSTGPTGERWKYYRTRAEGQNTLVINPSALPDQDPTAQAQIVRFESNDQDAFVVADLTAAYAGQANKVTRGIRLLDQRRQVLVQDEIEAKAPSDIWWFMHTRADIRVSDDGKTAILQLGTKRLQAQLLSPDPARFAVMDAKPLWSSPQPEGINPNNGIRKLAIEVDGAAATRISVLLSPLTEDQTLLQNLPAVQPIADWKLNQGPFAGLRDLQINGKPVAGFSPRKYSYYVYPREESGIPEVVASADEGTVVRITQAEGVQGTAFVDTWFANDPSKITRYVIHFLPGSITVPRDPDGMPVVSATASADDGNVPANTIDNSLATRWSAEGEQWIRYDLGQTSRVGAVTIAWYNGGTRKAFFDIQISEDGVNWNTVYSGQSSGKTADPELYPIGDRTARYVRILGHGNSSNHFNSITETDLFATVEDGQKFIDSFAKLDSLLVTASTNAINLGKTAELTVKGQWTNGTITDIEPSRIRFVSSDDKVLQVSASGTVTAVSEGSAVVSAIVNEHHEIKYGSLRLRAVEPNVRNVTAAADTYVYDGAPKQNYGGSTTLLVKDSSQGYQRETYMRFDLTGQIPDGSVIESATLYLNGAVKDSNGTEVDTKIFASDDSWKENEVTWENKPVRGQELAGMHFDSSFRWQTADLTEFVRQKAAVNGVVSLDIAQDLNRRGLALNIKSREDANKPYLKLKFRDTTPPVTSAELTGTKFGDWYTRAVGVSLSAADEESSVAETVYSLDKGASWTAYTAPFEVMDEGRHILQFRSSDTAGNTESVREVQFGIDLSAPAFLLYANGTVVSDVYSVKDNIPVTLSVTASDPYSGVEKTIVSVDGAVYSPDSVLDFAGKTGVHAVHVSVSDRAGHTAEGDFSVNVSTDIPALRALLERYAAQGEITGALEAQLRNELDQAEHQLGKGGPVQAAHQLEMWLEHMERPPASSELTDRAAMVLEADARELIRQWLSRS